MNKDVFHNQIALSLGYKRILQDKQIKISIDDKEDTEDPIIKIDILDGRVKIAYHASYGSEEVWQKSILPRQKDIIEVHGIKKELDTIIDGTNKAYIQATTNKF